MQDTDILKSPTEDTNDSQETTSETQSSTLINAKDTWSPNHFEYYGSESRTILIEEEINSHSANAIVSQIQQLSKLANTEPIIVHINTRGGDISAALMIYDALRSTKCTIVTVVIGTCYSAGLIILSAGDIRLALKHATFFYHQPLLSAYMNSEEVLESTLWLYKKASKHTSNIIRKRIEMSKSKWKKKFKLSISKYFDAKKALKYNFIDSVIQYQEKHTNKGKE